MSGYVMSDGPAFGAAAAPKEVGGGSSLLSPGGRSGAKRQQGGGGSGGSLPGDAGFSISVPQRVPAPKGYNAPPRVLPGESEEGGPPSPKKKWDHQFSRLKGPNRKFTVPRLGLKDYMMLAISSRRSGDTRKEALAYYNIGVLYDNVADYTNAVKAYDKYLALCMHNQDQEGQATAYNHLGVSYQLMDGTKHHPQAIACHKRHRKSTANPRSRVIALCNEGLAHRETGDIEKAMEYHRRAVEQSLGTDDEEGESLARGALGMTEIAEGSSAGLAAGRENMGRHMDLCHKKKDVKHTSAAFEQLGLLASTRGDYAEAFDMYSTSRELAMQAGEHGKADLEKCHIGIAKGSVLLEEYLAKLRDSGVATSTPARGASAAGSLIDEIGLGSAGGDPAQ